MQGQGGKGVALARLEGVCFSYRGRPVLQGVCLEVGAGEVLALAGPNGAGKTTLLRLMAGLLRPQQGRVLLDGMPSHLLPPRQRARLVAMVPQVTSLPPHLTALEAVLMGRTPHLGLLRWEGPADLESARRAMELTGTWALASRPVGTLSGGERQRVLLARALAQETPLLLLDEPTASLDLAGQVEVMEMVARVQGERRGAVVVAMHDLTLASRYAGRVCLLAKGRVLGDGSPWAVLTPETVARAYGTQVHLLPHPLTGTPVVVPLGANGRHKGGP